MSSKVSLGLLIGFFVLGLIFIAVLASYSMTKIPNPPKLTPLVPPKTPDVPPLPANFRPILLSKQDQGLDTRSSNTHDLTIKVPCESTCEESSKSSCSSSSSSKSCGCSSSSCGCSSSSSTSCSKSSSCSDKCASSCHGNCASTCESSCGAKGNDLNSCVLGDCTEVCTTNEIRYFTNLDNRVVVINGISPQQIQDIYQNGDKILVVSTVNTMSLTIRYKNGKTQAFKSILPIDQVFVFRGDIYIISNGLMYSIDPGCCNKTTWYWAPVTTAPTGIRYLTQTFDQQNLWIQTDDKFYLYDCNFQLIESGDRPITSIRIYGTDLQHAADLDTVTHMLTILSTGLVYSDVGQAIYNYKNQIVYLRPGQTAIISAMRNICNKIYFIF